MENQRLRSLLVLGMATIREDDDEGDESTAPFNAPSPSNLMRELTAAVDLDARPFLDGRFNGGE